MVEGAHAVERPERVVDEVLRQLRGREDGGDVPVEEGGVGGEGAEPGRGRRRGGWAGRRRRT